MGRSPRSLLDRRAGGLLILFAGTSGVCTANEVARITFAEEPGKVRVEVAGEPVATYVYDDPTITRPYFAHVHAPGGVQVTRNHPPVVGQDRMDHPEFHPGVWLAFGDVSGNDYWRLKARVVHDSFRESPKVAEGVGAFAVENHFLSADDPDKTVCREVCRYTIRVLPPGFLLTWDATFASDHEFSFGDQEEMGLGVRVATPLRVERKTDGGLPAGTGSILDAAGRVNETEIWGHAAEWCDYSGEIDGQPAGVAIFAHPENFRPSWWHVRDYGFLTANPFGRAAFRQGPPSQEVVKPGEQLRLRFGLLMHGKLESPSDDLAAAYRAYVEASDNTD